MASSFQTQAPSDRTNAKPTAYALGRLFLRGISVAEAVGIVRSGEEVAQARLESPRPSHTFLGWVERGGVRKPVHIVAAEDPDGTTDIITAYWPKPTEWDADFKRRIR